MMRDFYVSRWSRNHCISLCRRPFEHGSARRHLSQHGHGTSLLLSGSNVAERALAHLYSELNVSSDGGLHSTNKPAPSPLAAREDIILGGRADPLLLHLRGDEAFLLENSKPVLAEGIDMTLRLITPENPIYRYADSERAVPPQHLFMSLCCMFRYKEEDIARSRLRFLPFWGFLWPGGFALTKHIQRCPELFRDSLVVDLGCGCGSATVAAGSAGAAAVICNDIDPLALMATGHNIDIKLNHLGRSSEHGIRSTNIYFSVTDFITGRVEALNEYLRRNVRELDCISPNKRYLLVGDMLYDEEIGESVLRLAQALQGQGWSVLVGDPGRHFASTRSADLGRLEAEYDLPLSLRDQNNGLTRAAVRLMKPF